MILGFVLFLHVTTLGVANRFHDLVHGMEEALSDTLDSTIAMVQHPVQTFGNITFALAHPVRTSHAVQQMIDKECQEHYIWECIGYVFGHVLVFVMTEGVGTGIRAAGLGQKSTMAVYSIEGAHAGGLLTHISYHTDEYYRRKNVIAVPMDLLPARFLRSVSMHECTDDEFILRINDAFNIAFSKHDLKIANDFCPSGLLLNLQ